MTVDPADMVVSQILDRFLDNLTRELQTNIATTDKTYVSVVKSGRFQSDPVSAGNTIVVMNGDLDDPALDDGVVDLHKQTHRTGWSIEPREIGGTEMWYRRGTVRVSCFFIHQNYNEHEARQVAMKVMGRAERCLVDSHVADLRDEFYEHAIKVFVYGNTFFQSGGPPASYIWRGKINWQVLTERRWK